MTDSRRLQLHAQLDTHEEIRILLVKVTAQGFRVIQDPDRRGIVIETKGMPLSPEACLLMMREGEAFDTIRALDRVLDAVLDDDCEDEVAVKAKVEEAPAPRMPWFMVGTIGGLLSVLTWLVCEALARRPR